MQQFTNPIRTAGFKQTSCSFEFEFVFEVSLSLSLLLSFSLSLIFDIVEHLIENDNICFMQGLFEIAAVA